MTIKAFLFDLDGTLVTWQLDYNLVREKVIYLLQREGYPYKLMTSERYALRMLDAALSYFKTEHQWGEPKLNQLKQNVNAVISKIEHSAALKAVPIPGILKVLTLITHEKYKMGILTLNTTENAVTSLQKAGLADFFPDRNLIIGRDLSQNQKPHPDHPQRLLDKMQLSPDEVLLIGDHPTDIEAANEIGITSIALTGPNYDPEAFKTKYFVDKTRIYPDLLYLLNSLLK
jgi:HAD superfamily hydrolase (TIGR01509 family)